MNNELRISINGEQFGKLISGEVLTCDVAGTTVQVALADIGYAQMASILSMHMPKQGGFPFATPEDGDETDGTDVSKQP